MRFHGLRTFEARQHLFHCGSGSHFPLPLSTHAVGQNKQAPVGTDVRGRGREYVPKIVLIPRANRARIRKLRELDVEHRTAWYSVRARRGPARTKTVMLSSCPTAKPLAALSPPGFGTTTRSAVSQAAGTRLPTSVVRFD